MISTVLGFVLLGQCPGGYCLPGACSPCGDVVSASATPIRYVSASSCQQTAYGSDDVIAQLVAQQDRLSRQMRAISEDVATIRWQFSRPIGQPSPTPYAMQTPVPVPDKQVPSTREVYPTPQASPQMSAPMPRKALPTPMMPSPNPPQADAGLQWQRALQAHRVKLRGDVNLPGFRAAPEPDRTPFALD